MESYKARKETTEGAENKETAELRRLLSDLCQSGRYTESLLVEEDGTISLDRRSTESVPPLLPNLLVDELGARNVEAFYRVVQDIQERLPEFEFAISENDSRTMLTYTVEKRASR
jgi:hypothetical protein